MKYVTYHINSLGGKTPIAVDLTDLSEQEKFDIYFDAQSLAGLSFVRINNSGKVGKMAEIINKERHYLYDWEALQKQHYDKYYNPKNFAKNK